MSNMSEGLPTQVKVDTKQYQEFVRTVTSDTSNYTIDFIERIQDLHKNSTINISLLLTGALGLSAESGEVTDIVKKILFQGKPLDAASMLHLKRELGDICWYLFNTCRALNISFDEVLLENINTRDTLSNWS